MQSNTYKLIILAPSCGGKSSLMRYLREHTDLHIAETDEEVMKANNDVWPDDELKNKVLVPRTTNEIISRENVVYFASYIPTELIQKPGKRLQDNYFGYTFRSLKETKFSKDEQRRIR